jgi:hypothetical protein
MIAGGYQLVFDNLHLCIIDSYFPISDNLVYNNLLILITGKQVESC